jgi:hypothetical protein
VTAGTVEMTREMFHCPSWCVVPLEQHAAQLRSFYGGASHYSGPWEDAAEQPVAGSFTERDGSQPADIWPGVVWIGRDVEISPTTARTLAAKLIAAADLAETR